MRHIARKVALVAAIFAANCASAVDAWVGKGLPELYSKSDEISTVCGQVTGDQRMVDQFVADARTRRSDLGDALLKLVTSTKAVQAAQATKDLQRIKEATKAEAEKVKLTVSCKKSPASISLTARNGDGKKVDLLNRR